ncbi:ATP-binding protein [Permianibacter aggregans]|uniref:histidine kinase n=1 Tax=Permianibacter aggregans TaxID=1510150 RepID=A0A4R6URK5_9GAMM|nr:ATP-binding protein [Permianibacter aggregans]QGX39324.1 PAS domain S-box protein [Permianibacter aggregans]TDQ49938.1 PAS domain S-box-containing protein [Permianibacter aggregans]
MDSAPAYRPPVPLFLPALTAVLALTVLFVFGVREQQQLTGSSVERIVGQREQIAQIVAEAIEADLRAAESSVRRFAHDLSVNLEAPVEVPDAVFEQHFQALPDGSVRSRRDRFDPNTEAGVWIPRYVSLDSRLREFFVRAKTITELYGRGAHGQVFVDTWILPAVSGIVIHWPEEPEFVFQATADFDYRDTEWMTGAMPEQNPHRHVFWTKLAYDPVPKVWMLSAVAPLYWRGEWFGSVGHDVPLAKVLARTDLLRQQPGSQFVLITADDVVAASDVHADAIQASGGVLKVSELPNPLWQQAIAQARMDAPNATHTRLVLADHVAFVSRIREQNWLLVNLMPLQPITERIEHSFLNLRNIAVGTLLLELLIATGVLAWSHRLSQQYFANLNQMQQKLAVSEAHYRTLVANIPGMVYRCSNDADWTMSFVSTAAIELTGYPAEDFIGNQVRSYASVIYPADREQVDSSVQQALARKQPFVLEYRIVHRDGEIRWVLEHGRAVTVDNEVQALEGVILDISPLKQAEAKLHELNFSLEEQVNMRTTELRMAIKDLETFNYAVSHDLRAPLRHCTSYLSMIKDELAGHESADLQEWIKRCEQAVLRMNEMIGGMLALAQLGREALKPSKVDLSALVQELISELPDSVRSTISFDIGPLPVVQADHVLLRQVFHNVLDNAVKYSTGKERPVIHIHERSSESQNSEYVIEIRDNGIGFDANYSDKLFLLFHRLHRSSDFPGTGVGLALSAKILSLHGGRIWAQSELGKGASFFVALPRVAKARHKDEQKSSPATNDQ